jgi:predicted Zn finger-like uncharacterized protein
MTMLIQTQCPHCHTAFELPRSQLQQPDTKGRCGRCQQVFLVDKHLIIPATPISTQDPLATANLLQAAVADEALTEINAWLAQLEISSAQDTAGLNNSERKSIAADPADAQPESKFQSPAHSQSITSATTGNKASIATATSRAHSHTQRSQQSSTPFLKHTATANNKIISQDNKITGQNNNDLVQLLSTLSVSADQSTASSHITAHKIQQRRPATAVLQNSSLSYILWLTGCLLLTLLLLVQYIIFNLHTLVKNPTYAVSLQAICPVTVCNIPHADLTALTLSTPSYRPSRIKARSAFSDIEVELSNQSLQAQLLPNIKVSLYNNITLIGEFIAPPEAYLLSSQSQLAANSRKPLMFTVPVAANKISKVTIQALY